MINHISYMYNTIIAGDLVLVGEAPPIIFMLTFSNYFLSKFTVNG